jgi:hypothetical protein
MSLFEGPAPANNADNFANVEEPIARAYEQLNQIGAGSATAASINPADLQQTASAAVDVATALKGICCTTTGSIAPDIWT